MFNKITAMALTATLIIGLTACKKSEPEVMTLPTIGAPNDAPIATLDDIQSTQSVGPTHTPGGISESRGFVCALTESDAEGSNFVEGAPIRENIAPNGAEGDKLIVTGTVYVMTGGGCEPLEGAVIDVWQADVNGVYDSSQDFLYRGKVETDAEGKYRFETVVPGTDETQPKRIYLTIQHPNAVSLTTQLYFEGDAKLNGMTSQDSPRILRLAEENGVYSSSFDIVLSGK